MLLSEYYSNSKYAENGRQYEIVEFGKNQRSYFKIRCIVCGEESHVTAASVLSGRKPCLCSNKSNTTPERKLAKLLVECQKNHVEILDLRIGKAKDPIPCRCKLCGYSWDSFFNSLYYKSSGCPKCNNSIRLTELELLDQLNKSISDRKLNLVKLHFTSSGFTGDCRVDMFCKECRSTWQTSVMSIKYGRGCPDCAKYGYKKTEPATLYLLRIINDDILIGYKFGLTSNLTNRLYQHNKLCKHLGITFELSELWEYGCGNIAFEHEKVLKQHFPRVFDRRSLPSGSTEAILPQQLGELLDLQRVQYEEYLNGGINP